MASTEVEETCGSRSTSAEETMESVGSEGRVQGEPNEENLFGTKEARGMERAGGEFGEGQIRVGGGEAKVRPEGICSHGWAVGLQGNKGFHKKRDAREKRSFSLRGVQGTKLSVFYCWQKINSTGPWRKTR